MSTPPAIEATTDVAPCCVLGETIDDAVAQDLARVFKALGDPARTEGPISTPGWALDRAAQLGATAAEQIAASGARVVGALDQLAEHPTETPEATLPPGTELRLMVQLVVGALSGSMRRGPDFGAVRSGWPPARPSLDGVPTRHLAGVLRGRLADAARRRVHRDRG